MSIDAAGLFSAITSHAVALGLFERVNGHEPKSAPGNGLSAAVWVESIGPANSSGLTSTSAAVTFSVRIYSNFIQKPEDGIDINILHATDALMNEYSGDYELGSALNVRCVDLLGQEGTPLNARAGYQTIDDKVYRVMTITLPLIINDVWDQAA